MDKLKYDTLIKNLYSSIDRDSLFADIRSRGYSIERMAPFVGKHYDKYSFALRNGQEISFRIYKRDSIDEVKEITSSIINSFDGILNICASKIRFEKRKLLQLEEPTELTPFGGGVLCNWNYSMSYFDEKESIELNEVFLSHQMKDDFMHKLVSNPEVRKHYSHIYFRRLDDGTSEMLYNLGLSPQMLDYWEDCIRHFSLHYALESDEKNLETAAGLFVIPLKPITSGEQLEQTIDTISHFVHINNHINRKYPGFLFYPDFTFKIYPRKLKIKERPTTVPICDIGFTVGDMVHHKSFGDGVVKQINKDEGTLIVDFKSNGEKKLLCFFAKLEKR